MDAAWAGVPRFQVVTGDTREVRAAVEADVRLRYPYAKASLSQRVAMRRHLQIWSGGSGFGLLPKAAKPLQRHEGVV
jgi:hypothetical protein